MIDHFLSIEDFHEKINEWVGQQIKISKWEMDDVDETVLYLDKISYEKDTRRLDDYKALYTLHLEGEGFIQTDTKYSQLEPLPAPSYEIPLEEDALYEFNGEQFIISTERAVYKLELASH